MTLGSNIIEAVEAGARGRAVAEPVGHPWLVWLALALCRQRKRQSWLVEISRSHLADVDGGQGSVPGLFDWFYDFHGRGLCLSGPDNEYLDVDFHGDDGATIDPYFFATRVLRLSPRPAVEDAVARWFPTADLMVCGLDALRELGVIEHPDSDHVFRLCDRLEQVFESVARIDFSEEMIAHFWANQMGDDDDAPVEFRRWLVSIASDRRDARRVIDAGSAMMSPGELRELCERMLDGPIDATTGSAVEALDALADESRAVPALLHRFDPDQHHPYPVWATARYCLGRHISRDRVIETVERFARVNPVKGYSGNPYAANFATLMLRHCPERALPLIRLALRSSVPIAVQDIAALLAALDQTWCHRELAAALDDPAHAEAPHQRRYLAAALARSTSDVAKRRGSDKQPPDPVREAGAIGYSFDEVVAANLDTFFDSAISARLALAAIIRPLLADDFGAEMPLESS